jgi:hypothetical protein
MVRVVLVVALWKMRVWPLDLNEAFAAYRLVATPCMVQIWRVGQKTDGTFGCILVQENLDGLPIDEGIMW